MALTLEHEKTIAAFRAEARQVSRLLTRRRVDQANGKEDFVAIPEGWERTEPLWFADTTGSERVTHRGLFGDATPSRLSRAKSTRPAWRVKRTKIVGTAWHWGECRTREGRRVSMGPEAVHLAERVVLCRDHEPGNWLASTTQGTLRIFSDAVGLHFTADLPHFAEVEAMLDYMRAGGCYEASLGMRNITYVPQADGSERIESCRIVEISLCDEGKHVGTFVALAE